jgi:SAM-dependent methyltransferase
MVANLGLAGVALLRLHALRSPERAADCIEDIRRVLLEIDRLDSLEASTPMLDVAGGYARWSAVYDAPGNPLIDAEQDVIRLMLDEMDGNPVLDAACGTGRHLEYLARRGHDVIGVDFVPEMLDKAREKVTNADLRLGDLTSLPLDDGEVRGAVCSLALEHVADLPRAFSELHRVVASGGSAVVSTMHPVLRSIFGWGAWFVDDAGKTDVPTFEYQFADFVNAAARSGFVLRHCAEAGATESDLPYDANDVRRIAYSGMPMVLIMQFDRP